MALEAGELHFTLEYAKDLKDKDWFGKQASAPNPVPLMTLTCH